VVQCGWSWPPPWRNLEASDRLRRAELGLEYPEEGEQIVAMTDALAMAPSPVAFAHRPRGARK